MKLKSKDRWGVSGMGPMRHRWWGGLLLPVLLVLLGCLGEKDGGGTPHRTAGDRGAAGETTTLDRATHPDTGEGQSVATGEADGAVESGMLRSSAAPDGTAMPGVSSLNRQRLPDVIRAGKVEFRVGDGEEVFSFKPKNDGAACKFYNAKGEELCKLTLSHGKLKAKTPDDRPLFQLKPKGAKLMVKDATGEQELFKFKLKGDAIDCYRPGDVWVYRIKKRDYGWRLEDSQGKTLFRAKVREGKMVLRDANDQTVLYSKDLPSPLGLVFFRIDGLTQEQQAACCVMFLDR